jgi:hypothetical protein
MWTVSMHQNAVRVQLVICVASYVLASVDNENGSTGVGQLSRYDTAGKSRPDY